jgi:lipopolysaccharide transport system ATP-binding protein
MKQKEIKKKFDEIIDFADIGKFLDTPVKHYSSGMYMRLAFAVAAHLMTEILIVDEVLAVGDTDFQKKCLGKIHSLAGQGRTVLFVSHNMFSITRLCTRVLLLNNGLIDKDGKPVQITSYYLNNLEKLSGFKSNKKIKYDETKEMQLINVRLVIDSDVKTIIDVRDKFELVIEYRVNKPGLKCRCAASFFTQGFCVFTSVEPYELERVKNGCYSSTLTIPSNLLTEGDYVIGISINTSKGGLYHFIKAKDILSFRVVDSKGGTSARGDFTYNLVGVIRPLLDWRTKYINN